MPMIARCVHAVALGGPSCASDCAEARLVPAAGYCDDPCKEDDSTCKQLAAGELSARERGTMMAIRRGKQEPSGAPTHFRALRWQYSSAHPTVPRR
eukprot:4162350-Prymnesium_polylepis.1